MTNPEPKKGKPRTCQFCGYWIALSAPSGKAEGECRRFPPMAQGKGFLNQAMQATEDAHMAIWVHTKTDEWCGEWKEKKEVISFDYRL
jgi:hypothetical protein